MARKVDAAKVAEKFARVTPTRSEDFVTGVQNPSVDWKTATDAASSSYEQGLQQSIAAKRFNKGVAKAGTGKWQAKTVQKGSARWAPGVQEAAPDFEAGFAPFAQVINSTALPQRFSRGDPRNIARVSAIASALSTAKRK